jgi:hypothetical protein
MDINETIATELHYKDICLIAVMSGMYQTSLKENGYNYDNSEFYKRAVDLVNRLGREMSDCPQPNQQ